MYLLSRIRISLILVILLTLSYNINAQTLYVDPATTNPKANPRTISGGTRTLYIDNPTVLNCPNTYEYVPDGFDFNNTAVKYPIIIGFPGLSEMIGQYETTTAAMTKFVNENIYLSAGIQQIVERGEFPVTTKYNGQDFQFIVIGVQCKNNASNTSQTPFDVENLINNYILNKYAEKVDWNRIYLTGISAGGGLVWEYFEVAKRGAKIAAIVPIAPGTIYVSNKSGNIVTGPPIDYTPNFNTIIANIVAQPSLGIFAAHNQIDSSVHVGVSHQFINAVNAVQPGRAFLNVFTSPPPPTDHNAWIRAYDKNRKEFNGSNMYEWMLSHQSAFAIFPVTLTSFDAVAKNNAVELTWNTESESNSSHFAVERSSNGREFKEIGRVNSSGNSTTAKNYKFTDNSPLTGNNYYRLKMVDLDATFKYSEVRRVSMNGSDLEFSFGPNPVINEANIRITGNQRTRLNITVTDLMGRTLKSMNFSKSDIVFSQKINLAELPAGQYVLSIKGDNVNYTQRIMKR